MYYIDTKEQVSPTGNQFLIEMNRASAVHDMDMLIEFVNQPEYKQMSLFDGDF